MCSHAYHDVRFMNQLVNDWHVAPYIDPSPAMNDGKPRRQMQYGQTYRCCGCGVEISPVRPLQLKGRDDVDVQ